MVDEESWLMEQPAWVGQFVRSIPNEMKPIWAFAVIAAVAAQVRKRGLVVDALQSELARRLESAVADQDRWAEAKSLFREIRAEALRGSLPPNPATELSFDLLEKLAKMTYNATMPRDAFDDSNAVAGGFVRSVARLLRELPLGEAVVATRRDVWQVLSEPGADHSGKWTRDGDT